MPTAKSNLTLDENFAAASDRAKPVPFDFKTATGLETWRDDLAWPISYTEQFEINEAVMRGFLAVLSAIEDADLLDIATLVVAALSSSTLVLAETALAIERQAETGIRLVGEAPELAYLRGEVPDEQRPEPRAMSAFLPTARPRAPFLRRLARIRSWSPWSRVAQAIMAPRATAISHNPLLREAAGTSDFAVGFRHAETLFSDATRRNEDTQPIAGWQEVAERFTAAATDTVNVSDSVSRRLGRLVGDQAGWMCERAARDLARLRKCKNLPQHIWAGSAGYWPIRALSIEVLRRGGEVTRFDHGGGSGLVAGSKALAIIDLVISDRFVLPTRQLAGACNRTGIAILMPEHRQTKFEGANGDPKIRAVLNYPKARQTDRRRALFAPTALIGFRQVSPPLLPDPIHLDWQIRLATQLKSLPVDLTCRAHSEGIVSGQAHPLSRIIDLSPTVFEKLAGESDVFVFYFSESTTFYVALCTDRPVVLIDLGLPIHTAEARAMIDRRCRIVTAKFDDRNLPYVDPQELREAVCGGNHVADPTEFRALILGAGTIG